MLTRVLNLRNIRPVSKGFVKFYDQLHTDVAELDVDVLDDFTSQLVQRNTDKLSLLKSKYENLLKANKPSNMLDQFHLKDVPVEQITELFQDALEGENSPVLVQLVDKCIESKKYPRNMLNVLSHFAQNGDRHSIRKLRKLCELCCPDFLRLNGNFDDFQAEAVWIRGDVPKSLTKFERVYRNNRALRARIRATLKYLIVNLVCDKSEAALLNTIAFAERLCRDFDDFFPLACVWQACLLSQWFSDQNTAFDLLKRNEGLCENVLDRIPYVVFLSLKCHRTEVVYRLLEILLAFKLKQHTSYVLASLLDYEFCMRDLKRCAEIIQWSIANDVNLPNSSNVKSISLILNRKLKMPFDLKHKEKVKRQVTLKF